MVTEFKAKTVKCRKPHRCEWCPELVEIGEPAHYRAGVYHGDFYHGWCHMVCWMAQQISTNSAGFRGMETWEPGSWEKGETYAEREKRGGF